MNGKEVVLAEDRSANPLTVVQVREQINMISALMKDCMKDEQHFGKIPGTAKPSLYKAGAEKLCLMFRLDPQYEVLESIKRDDLISYGVRCTLYSMTTGARVASGMGSCNSREKKYAHHAANPYEVDNTLLKMACKRAHVAAVLNGTAASDIFTQDVEDVEPGHAQAAPAGQATAGHAAGPKISEPQAKRFYAIAKSNGKTDEQMKAYLKTLIGSEKSMDMTRAVYDKACEWAASKVDAADDGIEPAEVIE